MPICHLETNLPESAFPPGFEDDLAQFYSSLVGRPTERIFVCVVPGRRLRVRDSGAPGVVFRMGGLNVYREEAKRREYSMAVAKYVGDRLKIPLDRMVMDVRHIDLTELAMLNPMY